MCIYIYVYVCMCVCVCPVPPPDVDDEPIARQAGGSKQSVHDREEQSHH